MTAVPAGVTDFDGAAFSSTGAVAGFLGRAVFSIFGGSGGGTSFAGFFFGGDCNSTNRSITSSIDNSVSDGSKNRGAYFGSVERQRNKWQNSEISDFLIPPFRNSEASFKSAFAGTSPSQRAAVSMEVSRQMI